MVLSALAASPRPISTSKENDSFSSASPFLAFDFAGFFTSSSVVLAISSHSAPNSFFVLYLNVQASLAAVPSGSGNSTVPVMVSGRLNRMVGWMVLVIVVFQRRWKSPCATARPAERAKRLRRCNGRRLCAVADRAALQGER